MQREQATSKGTFSLKVVSTVFLKSQRRYLASQVWFLVAVCPFPQPSPAFFWVLAACRAEEYPLCQDIVLGGVMLHQTDALKRLCPCLRSMSRQGPASFLVSRPLFLPQIVLLGWGRDFSWNGPILPMVHPRLCPLLSTSPP